MHTYAQNTLIEQSFLVPDIKTPDKRGQESVVVISTIPSAWHCYTSMWD